MKTIIVYLAPYRSHYLPFEKLLHELKENGYNVVILTSYCNVLLYDFIKSFWDEPIIILKDTLNPLLEIKQKEIKNWDTLFENLNNNSDNFPFNLLKETMNCKNEKTINDTDKNEITKAFCNLIRQTDLYNRVKENIKIPKQSYAFERLNFLDEPKAFFQDKQLEIQTFNNILLSEILFPQYIKKPFYFSLYRSDFILFRILRRYLEMGFHMKVFEMQFSPETKYERLKDIIEKHRPVAFILEPFTSYLMHLLKKEKVDYILVTSTCFNEKRKNMPPLDSYFIPKKSVLSCNYVNFLWQKKNILGLFHKQIYIKHFVKNKKSLSPRTMGIRLKDCPELILGVKEFEYPITRTALDDNIHFIGPKNMNYTSSNNKFDWESIGNYNKLIYFSFGTVVDILLLRNAKDDFVKFINRIIQACSEIDGLTLIISLGGRNFPKHELINSSKNIHIFDWVPQQTEILNKASLAITHGGLGTVKECLINKVPMLAYPIAGDQFGNSGRIVYHKLGLRGKYKRDSSKKIKQKIQTILKSESISQNVKKMNEIFLNSYNRNTGAEVIESILNNS